MSTPLPTQTPNIIIENPTTRKRIRTVLDLVLLGLVAVVAADISPAFDLSGFTIPALAVVGVFRAGFGLGIDNPNTPSY